MIVKTSVILLFIVLVIPKSYAKSEKIIACIDDYPPYQILDNVPHGIHITSLHRLANALNKQLEFIEAPNFGRCVKMLELGQADVIAGLNKNRKRDAFAFYAPYKIEDGHVFISARNNVINHYSDLANKIIGVPRGTTYFEQFEYDKSLNKTPISNVSTGIQLLLKKRIDVIITSKFVADSLLTEIKTENLETRTIKREKDKPYMSFFGFSKKNKLNLTEDKIIALTTAAFEQGIFKN